MVKETDWGHSETVWIFRNMSPLYILYHLDEWIVWFVIIGPVAAWLWGRNEENIPYMALHPICSSERHSRGHTSHFHAHWVTVKALYYVLSTMVASKRAFFFFSNMGHRSPMRALSLTCNCLLSGSQKTLPAKSWTVKNIGLGGHGGWLCYAYAYLLSCDLLHVVLSSPWVCESTSGSRKLLHLIMVWLR